MTAEELKALMTQVMNDSVAPLRAELEALKAAQVQVQTHNDSTDEEKPPVDEKKENDSIPAAVEAIAGPLDTTEADSDVPAPVAAAPVTADSDEAQESGQNAEIAELKAKIAALEAATKAAPVLSDEEEAAIADAQVHADSVYQMHGQRAPRPMERESLLAYRRRLARGLQKFSDSQKDVKISAINDSQYLDYVEKQVYADAAKAAQSGVTLKRGLQKIEKRGAMGQTYFEYVGDIGSWLADSSLQVAVVKPHRDRKYITV